MKLRFAVLGIAGTLLLNSCAGISIVSIAGRDASTHSVDLSWVASGSADVSGYNVYRAQYTGSCGSFSKINPLLVKGTSFRDEDVADGESYCYATTAVSSSNKESAYSNVVSDVQIPQT